MILFDFSDSAALEGWISLDDVVMGGVSSSALDDSGEGFARFHGTVSRENNGGFASVRSAPLHFDLGAFDGLALRVRGDGKRYRVNLKNAPYRSALQFRGDFETTAGEWCTVELPFDRFRPTVRGRTPEEAVSLDTSAIVSVGLMIADAQTGTFSLEIARIEALRRTP